MVKAMAGGFTIQNFSECQMYEGIDKGKASALVRRGNDKFFD
jgi:hypothetical protein